MNVVLYTVDFEPLTVLDLPLWLIEQLERQGSINVALQEPINLTANTVTVEYSPKIVTIKCCRVRWHDNSVKTVLITPDEEFAMLLKPDWLAGQRGTINNYKTMIHKLTDTLFKTLQKRG